MAERLLLNGLNLVTYTMVLKRPPVKIKESKNEWYPLKESIDLIKYIYYAFIS